MTDNAMNVDVPWMSRETFFHACREKPEGLPPPLRLLLLSDGTVTHFLETLFLETIAFELEAQSEIVVAEDDAERLCLPKGEKGIKRSGWLTVSGGQDTVSAKNKDGVDVRTDLPSWKRVVYAVSILPLARLTPLLYQEIILSQKPLGRIIHDQKLNVRRDHLEIGRVVLHDVARAFGLPPDRPLWARRYRLSCSEAREGLGIIFEAFSSEIAGILEKDVLSGKMA